jgi:hypothetical protein
MNEETTLRISIEDLPSRPEPVDEETMRQLFGGDDIVGELLGRVCRDDNDNVRPC